jgi:hypothetical protein
MASSCRHEIDGGVIPREVLMQILLYTGTSPLKYRRVCASWNALIQSMFTDRTGTTAAPIAVLV